MVQDIATQFRVRLAQTEDDMRAAQRLRYQVFIEELGGGGDLVDHANRLEKDRYDAFCDHLLLEDLTTEQVVGVYRLMRQSHAEAASGFYSAGEYDLSVLTRSGRRLLELGRSCLHADYRGGGAMHQLWSGLAEYVARHQIDVLFGVASFHGTDVDALAQPLSLLNHRHLAPEELRVRALDHAFQSMNLIDKACLDRKAATMQMPSLIKAYLRLGGFVGEGAFVDHAFNTIDVCLIMDTARLSARQARIYGAAS
jgi:putative hemolysin